MFIKEDMFAEHITVNDLKKKLNEIYASTESMTQYNAIHDNLKEIVLKDLIQEDEENYSGRQTTVALCTAMAETIALAKLVVKS